MVCHVKERKNPVRQKTERNQSERRKDPIRQKTERTQSDKRQKGPNQTKDRKDPIRQKTEMTKASSQKCGCMFYLTINTLTVTALLTHDAARMYNYIYIGHVNFSSSWMGNTIATRRRGGTGSANYRFAFVFDFFVFPTSVLN
jgi:hypothetical protein